MIVTDNFNRADSATLGANWTVNFGANNFKVLSNKAQPINGAGGVYEYWNGNLFSNDQYSQVVLSNFVPQTTYGGGYLGVQVRASGTNGSESGYGAFFLAGNVGELYKYVAGAYVVLNSTLFTPSTGDTIKLSVVGSTITYYVNGVQKAQVVDGGVLSGAPGIAGNDPSGVGLFVIDDWEGGDVSAGTIAKNNIRVNQAVKRASYW